MEKIDYAALVEQAKRHAILSDDKSHLICQLAAAIERLTQTGGEVEPVGYWQGQYSKDGGATLYEVEQVSVFGIRYVNHPVYSAPDLARLIAERDAAIKHAGEVGFRWAEAEQERDALQEQVKVLRPALENNQWVEYNDPDYGTQRFCPDCRTDKKVGLHHPTCEIGQALAATEPKERP